MQAVDHQTPASGLRRDAHIIGLLLASTTGMIGSVLLSAVVYVLLQLGYLLALHSSGHCQRLVQGSVLR